MSLFRQQPSGRLSTTNLIDKGYSFGADSTQEVKLELPKDRRTFRLSGVPADAEYLFQVAPIRDVDQDVAASGVLTGPSGVAQVRSLHPSQIPNITANVGGLSAATVATGASKAHAGLDGSGNVARPIPSTIRVASGIMGHASGATFLGDLNATYGANAATNITNHNMDNIADGTTYGRPLASRLSSGKPLIDFSEGIHLNKSLANLDGTANTKLSGIAAGATVGADWSSNLTSRPTELTDGRVSAGLNASGGIDFSSINHTNKSLANVDSTASTKLSGIAAGATVGADWATNLASRPTELTDGRVAAGLNSSGGIDFSAAAHTNKSLANVDSTANTKLSGIAAGATVGATWGTNIASTPANLAALAGTEGINNTLVTLTSAGALSGAGGGSIAYDSLPDGTTYAKIKKTYMTTGQPNLQIGTTGQQIGDVRNLPPVRGANLGYKYSGTLSVGTVTTTTAAISITAGNITAGAATIAYNAMSASITGLSASTTYTYFFYVSDTGYTGGTKTLLFTTDNVTPYSNDAYIYMGSATIVTPASGSQSGAGAGGGTYTGGGGCVQADSWIETKNRGWVQAKDITVGDRLRVLTKSGNGLRWAPVKSNKIQTENGYEIVSESGIKLRCSTSTPLTLKDGSFLSMHDLNGHELPVFEHGKFRWEPCTAAFKGMMSVCYISLGGLVYAAGAAKGRAILTHNTTYKA